MDWEAKVDAEEASQKAREAAEAEVEMALDSAAINDALRQADHTGMFRSRSCGFDSCLIKG
jgi:hypothetical protein